MNVENYDSKTEVKSDVERAILKLSAGQRIRNVRVTGCMEGVSDYGAFTIIFLKTSEDEELSLLLGGNVFGRNGIKALTIGEENNRVVNPAVLNKDIWIGKSKPIKGNAGKTYYNFQFGFEEDA